MKKKTALRSEKKLNLRALGISNWAHDSKTEILFNSTIMITMEALIVSQEMICLKYLKYSLMIA